MSAVVLSALVAVACGVILWASVPPVVDFPFAALAGSALLVLGVVWVTLTLIGWFRYRTWRASVIAPAVVVCTAGLVMVDAPFRLGFQLSRGALTSAAAECSVSYDDRRIGVYDVWTTNRNGDDGCLFYIRGGLIDSVGLAYMPSGAPYLGKPRHDGDIGYEHLAGDWYRFVKQF
ncbi:hypothetical protein [Rhodococcus gannanensis]|uniref:DUF1109 domain-containing protein n=1 Tax=Rhodococcus gannanensis TaxID=1960308 RepID=A0ABW4P6H8_9NOCA